MKHILQQPDALLSILKITGLIAAILIGSVLLILILVGSYQTYKVQHSKKQDVFRSGHLPKPLPDGFYKGNDFTGLGKGWQGKVFEQDQHQGINQFNDGQRYVFKTYEARGLRDKGLTVLRIDYNQPGNPWWLHFVVDEVVETEPGHYLGKVHVKVLPGLTFTLTYFELSKQ